MGMGTTFLDPRASQIGKKESIADTACVLGRMYDGIEYRGFEQSIVEELAKYAPVPVWNGLTNEYHTTQVLADMLTIIEHKGHLKGIKLVYMGDARYNMGNSLMIASAKMGMDFVACAPKKYHPNKELVDKCLEIAKETGAKILDVGYGNGDTLKRLEEKLDAVFYGIDISPDMKVLATKANARAVAEEKMFLTVGDVEDMPYEDSFFDCVYTINTVYFWKDAGRAMDETVRVLKDGGRFICGFYSKAYFERSEKYQYEGETYYTTGELKELAAAHGLEKVKVKVVDEKKFMYCLIGEKRGNGIVEDSADE
jgi:SAM-dependent methyltransferase